MIFYCLIILLLNILFVIYSIYWCIYLFGIVVIILWHTDNNWHLMPVWLIFIIIMWHILWYNWCFYVLFGLYLFICLLITWHFVLYIVCILWFIHSLLGLGLLLWFILYILYLLIDLCYIYLIWILCVHQPWVGLSSYNLL